MIVSGTGTRQVQLMHNIDKARLRDIVVNHLQSLQATHVLTGMAEGFDSCLAWAAAHLDIPFTAVLPTPTYGSFYWGERSLTGKNRHKDFIELLSLAANQVIVSDRVYVPLGNGRRQHSNFVRNYYLVDHSDHTIVLRYNGVITSGTRHCYDYALAQEQPLTVVEFNA